MASQHARFGRWKRSWTIAVVVVSVIMASLFFTTALMGSRRPSKVSFSNPLAPGSHISFPHSSSPNPYPTLPFDELIRQLYDPRKLGITQSPFIDGDGKKHKLPWRPRYKESLGRRLVILDIDTRPFDGDGEVFSGKEWNWPRVERLSAGMMSHYMYSIIHGYDYLVLRSPKYNDRHDAWGKVLMMQHALERHEYVVFLDSDAILPYPELPMEWLMNYWKISDKVAITMASEPSLDRDKDEKGNAGQNSGFMILQNTPKTEEIFRNWAECPEETHYEGCQKWKWDHNREQDAWSNYLRYEFEKDIKILSCDEANGYPQVAEETHCSGVFLRHHWLHKQFTKDIFAENVMGPWASRLHNQFMEQYDDLVEDLRDKKLVGSMIVEADYEADR